MHSILSTSRIGGTTQQYCSGAITATGFGRYFPNEAEPDWTFRNLSQAEDAHKDSVLTRQLPAIMGELGVRTVWAPSPVKFNGLICSTSNLNVRIPLRNGVTVYRGAAADGCLLKPGEAFALSAAGCAVLVGWRIDPKTHRPLRVGVAHAGLVSIINDVAGSLLRALGCAGEGSDGSPEDAYFAIAFAINSHLLRYQWTYPKTGWQNECLCRFIKEWWGAECLPGWYSEVERSEGRVSTANMIVVQLTSLGVPRQNIVEGIDVDDSGRFYHTRESSKRNLMVVTYK